MSAAGSCPSCGSPLTFRAETTLTTVCAYCRSIVVRGDAKLELVGKTNEVLVSSSALQIGVEGTHQGSTFTVIGRIQLQHDLGGVWEEWLLRFANGKLAWLAEHQGRYALMAEANVHNAPRLKDPADAKPGASFFTPVGELIVVEQGVATLATQQGELPSLVTMGARRPFVDFTSRSGRWASLDFGAIRPDGTREPKRFFVGRELTATQLGLPTARRVAPVLPVVEGAKTARCPSCGGAVSKHVEAAQSLSCKYCNAVLSVDENEPLGLLFAQERLRHQPRIHLGRRAVLDARFFAHASRWGDGPRPWPSRLRVQLVAHLVRSVEIDGERYTFDEYLLETVQEGFFWLIESDGQWLFARHLDAGLVEERNGAAFLDGQTFQRQQVTQARVEQILGELYWRAHLHDASLVVDYRNSPRTLSREATAGEVIWTECLDIPTDAVERVFGPLRARPASNEDTLGDSSQKGALWLIPLFLFFPVLILIQDCNDDERDSANGRGSSAGGSGFHFGK